MNSLTLHGIEKAYNRGKASEVVVLRGASLTVAAGEVVALVAPSGAGKSTLLQIAGLLDVADQGTVQYGARQMTGLNDRARTDARRAEVGFIYQFHHLLPEFSALENITLPQLAHGIAKPGAEARARDLLARVGVLARASHRLIREKEPVAWDRSANTKLSTSPKAAAAPSSLALRAFP